MPELNDDEMTAAVDLLREVLGAVPVAAGPLDAVVRHRAEGTALALEELSQRS